MSRTFTNAALLGTDGMAWRDIVVRDGLIEAIVPTGNGPRGHATDLGGAIVSVPMCDLQVNGGGGLMLGDCRSVADLRTIADAHLRDGVPQILPTLISDSSEEIARLGALIEEGSDAGLTGLLGLHLEGPHITRPGAHDPAMMRPLTDADLAAYVALRSRVGILKITVAPDLVPPATITRLTDAGIIVALGHSNCDAATARAAVKAGARTATHLFNAMSGLDHRAPGLALAALEHGTFGLIADGIHVHPDMLRLAGHHMRGAYLVSDAMAVAGTTDTGFTLGGRRIARAHNRLTLDDGTLAGADLTLAHAVEVMARSTDLPRAECIAMATCAPRALIGLPSDLRVGDAALFQIWQDAKTPDLHLPGD